MLPPAGHVINTGTPVDVALGRADTPYLRAGDVVEMEMTVSADIGKRSGKPEVGADADVAHVAADETTRRWWQLTNPCQQPLDTTADGEWWVPAEEVFHLDL